MQLTFTINRNFFSFIAILFFKLIFLVSVYANTTVAMNNVIDDEMDDLTKQMQAHKITKPLTLTRASNGNRLAHYSQELTSQGTTLFLSRKTTKNEIQYVHQAAQQDGGITHLLAKGFYDSEKETMNEHITTELNFAGVSQKKHLNKKMEWVSEQSKAKSNDQYYIRTPQSNYQGGHAEPQLITDIEDVFKKDSNAVVALFTPPAENKDFIYMCGLDIFGPYDMCDAFKKGSKNKYNCIGQLRDFRKENQKGQQSISYAIRHKLKDQFKGKKEDAFVVIYHAYSPYENVHTYKAEDDKMYYPLNFIYKGCKFLRDNFDDSYTLSQLSSITTESDMLYGYIHQLADQTVKYNPVSKSFSFN